MAGQGMLYTWGDAETLKRTVTNFISIIDPQETPALSYFGMGAQNWGRFQFQDYPNGKIEWLKDTLRVRVTALSGDLAIDGTALSVDDPHLFKVGDVWEDEATGELIRVTAADGSNPITIERNYGGGTLAAAILTDAEINYKFSARDEGAESNDTPFTTPSSEWNQSQIFHAEIKLSGSERNAVSRYGIPDSYIYQLQKWLGGAGAGNGQMGRAGDLMIDMENAFFRGKRVTRSDSNADGAFGGLDYFITNRTDLSGAAPTEDDVMDAMQVCWEKGGKPNVLICNATNKRLITSWYKDLVQTERSERTGGVVIDTIQTEFGMLDLMLNRYCPPTKIFGAQRDLVGVIPLREFFVEPLSKGGDYTKDEIIGEYTMIVKHGAEAHFVLENTA